MTDKYNAMVLASFAADTLALGAHWIYDTDKIDERFGRIENPVTPVEGSYHAGREKGDFTHYGDQALLLLQTLDGQERFRVDMFASEWQRFMSSYDGYKDRASKQTLDNLEKGKDAYTCGSPSTDLGGAARIAPLLFHFRADFGLLLSYVREQTAMTHHSDDALTAAEFLCRVTWDVLHGNSPTRAVQDALETGVNDITLDLRIRNVLELRADSTRAIIKECGQACGTAAALPAVVHLVTTYQDNLQEALIENVMAGGDSAARGMAAAMILGAHLGMQAIPTKWLDDMKATARICDMLARRPD